VADLRSELQRCGYKESPQSEAIESKLQKWHPDLKPVMREIIEFERQTGIVIKIAPLEALALAFLPLDGKKNFLERIRDRIKSSN
jgi:hypothetical protein